MTSSTQATALPATDVADRSPVKQSQERRENKNDDEKRKEYWIIRVVVVIE
jgi:hypothetical protein